MPANDPASERFLVTGALGCVGAWVVKLLVDEGAAVVTFDKGDDAKRLRLVMGQDGPSRVTMLNSDITDADAIGRALDEHDITHVIHLAALQLPFARANPPLGALVNVVDNLDDSQFITPAMVDGELARFERAEAALSAIQAMGLPSLRRAPGAGRPEGPSRTTSRARQGS